MADFLTRFAVYNEGSFKARVGIAAAGVAYQAISEGSPTVVWTRKRAALAWQVLSDPVGVTDRFALILAALDVPVDVPDEALQNMIRSGWDALAGVTAEDRT